MKSAAAVGCLLVLGFIFLVGGATQAGATSSCTPPKRIGPDHPPRGELVTHKISRASAKTAIANGRLIHGGNLKTRGFNRHVVHRYQLGGVTTSAKIHCHRASRQFAFGWAT